MPSRREFLAALGGAAAAARAQASRPPNILFIFSDDHAYQAISAYGSRLNRTPEIDRIAREGMRLDQCLVTNSICAPSRAVILTGKYSHLNGVLDNSTAFDGSQTTFPKLLKARGYETALVGKWHLQSEPTGFNHWEILPGQGHYYNPDFLTPQGRVRRDGYVTDIITERTLDWLRHGRDAGRPFLMMCQHKAPHRNWMPAPDKLHLYEGVEFEEPPTLFDDYSHRARPAREQQMSIERNMFLMGDLKIIPPNPPEDSEDYQRFLGEYGRMSEGQRRVWDAAYRRRNEQFFRAQPQGKQLVRWKYQRYMQDYLACIASVDESVGRLLDWLEETGEAARTLVVYASDQGFYLGEHGWFDKRWIYEESIRTPLLVRWPGVTPAGSATELMVANIDLAETFLEAAGAAVPGDMQGRSLAPVLRGERPRDWRTSFYYHYYEEVVHNVARHEGVRTARYTLAHFYDTGEWELFDRERDPHQVRSVYGDPAYGAVETDLKAELARLRRQLKVPEQYPPQRQRRQAARD